MAPISFSASAASSVRQDGRKSSSPSLAGIPAGPRGRPTCPGHQKGSWHAVVQGIGFHASRTLLFYLSLCLHVCLFQDSRTGETSCDSHAFHGNGRLVPFSVGATAHPRRLVIAEHPSTPWPQECNLLRFPRRLHWPSPSPLFLSF